MPRNSATRNTRILAMDVSKIRKQDPQCRQFENVSADSGRKWRARLGPRAAPRHKEARDQRGIEKELELSRQLDHREVASGIFEHHGLVHHGQLEVGRRVIDGNARVFGNRDDN